MEQTRPSLKKPIILQILAILFIVAPLGNILISFYGVGSSDWTKPAVFLSWASTIDILDWFWLLLTFSTGILLFIQHKTAWLMAMINLMLILSVNIYRWATTGELIDVEYSYFQTQIAFSILATLATLGILFYARFPYLDRRSRWLGSVAPRIDIKTLVTVVAQDVYNGFATNISVSGMVVELNKSLSSGPAMKFVDVIFPDLGNLKIKCRLIQADGMSLRLKFRDLQREDKKRLKDWIRSQSLV